MLSLREEGSSGGWGVQQLGVVPLEMALVGVEEGCPTSVSASVKRSLMQR